MLDSVTDCGLVQAGILVVTNQVDDFGFGERAHAESVLSDLCLATPGRRFLCPPNGFQRVCVGPEQARTVAEGTVLRKLRNFEGSHGSVELAKIRPCSSNNHRQLNLACGVKRRSILGAREIKGTVRPSEPAFAIGHERKMRIRSADAAVGAEFPESFTVMAGRVRGNSDGFADDREAATAPAGRKCVLERQLGVILDQAPRHNQVLGYPKGAALLEITDLGTRDLVELTPCDILVDLRRTLPVWTVGTPEIPRVVWAAELTLAGRALPERPVGTAISVTTVMSAGIATLPIPEGTFGTASTATTGITP